MDGRSQPGDAPLPTDAWRIHGALAERRVSSLDRTSRLLLRFHDGAAAECVLMHHKGRALACLSSQAGCALGCRFCATGALGFRRDLTVAEILAQFAECRIAAGQGIHGLVFMGMGEPLLNFANVTEAIRALADPKGGDVPQRRITVSTVGVAPGILALAGSGLSVNLALSVVTADAAQRADLVPAEARHPLREALAAAREFCRIRRREALLQYILFDGLNDSAEHAGKLAALAHGLPCTVSLIRCNPVVARDGRGTFAPSPLPVAKAFQRALMDAGVRAYLRRETGADIAAACGQLAG